MHLLLIKLTSLPTPWIKTSGNTYSDLMISVNLKAKDLGSMEQNHREVPWHPEDSQKRIPGNQTPEGGTLML